MKNSGLPRQRIQKNPEFQCVFGLLLNFLPVSKGRKTSEEMKVRMHSETYFSAKMALLFALVFLGMPGRRKGLELFVKSMVQSDSSRLGQIPVSRMSGQAHFQSAFNQ
jgi:hypothetical protein